MTAIDDLRVGMFVAVTTLDREVENPYGQFDLFSMMGSSQRRKTTYGGQPLEILAISLPFLSVTDAKSVFAVDVREVQLQKLDKRYVRAMTMDATRSIQKTNAKRRRTKKQKPDPSRCPRCKCGRLIQRLIVKAGEPNEWSLVCTQCGYQGEVVSA